MLDKNQELAAGLEGPSLSDVVSCIDFDLSEQPHIANNIQWVNI